MNYPIFRLIKYLHYLKYNWSKICAAATRILFVKSNLKDENGAYDAR
jgi:hypothetical protein